MPFLTRFFTSADLGASLRARLWQMAGRLHVPRQKAAVGEILAQHPGQPVWIFPPALDWEGNLFQRPQQLALALAGQKAGAPVVFYADSLGTRRPVGFQRLAGNLYRCHVPLAVLGELQEAWVYCLTWQKYLRAFPQQRLVYDFVDDLSVFAGRRAWLEAQHATLLKRATRVLVTAERLRRQVAALRPDALLCPNGVDYAHFAAARQQGDAPSDLAPLLATGRPLVGYHGALAHWLDFELLAEVIRLRPDLSFVLIGPDHDGTLANSGLLALPNLSWLGAKPYEALPGYVRHFDAGMIPFRLNEITHSVSPLKLFELMAAGKPAVITPMEESLRYPGVLVATTPQDFAGQLDRALLLKNDPEHLELLDQQARQNTWEARARQILDSLPQ